MISDNCNKRQHNNKTVNVWKLRMPKENMYNHAPLHTDSVSAARKKIGKLNK
jgi:hypothetical protein